METSEQATETTSFQVKNVGGITETTLEIPHGVTILAGDNATNRTSFLQAIMAVMGSTNATLKGDADEGWVHLELGGETYNRQLVRVEEGLRFDGDSYLEDQEVADLFAFLLESNEARQAVARGDDLREVIMRPVDVQALRRDIERLEAEKGEINDELASIEDQKMELPKLEQRRDSLRDRIEKKRDELAGLEANIDDHSRDVNETRREQAELDEKLGDLRSTRSELESARRNIESQQEAISSLKQEQQELEAELTELPEAPMGEHTDLKREIERLRDERQALNAEISDLQSLIQYNEERLEENDYELLEALEGGVESGSGGTITDQLLTEAEDAIVCWTCGSTVDRDQIDDTVDRLKDLRSRKVSELNDIKDRLDNLKSDRQEVEQAQRRREELEQKLDDTRNEVERRQDQFESLKDRREDLTNGIERLEAEVNNLESEDFNEVLDLHKQANQLEFEIDGLESDLEDVSDKIEHIETMVTREDDLRANRESLADELEDLRTRIDQIEQDAVNEFNDHMGSILNVLKYENLERIWIERVQQTVRDGRKKVEQSAFDLHVVRTTENGTAYEDTVEHLSESEREVTGLVFALAGYLVHDLHEEVPFVLLDSLEAIDSNRIARLVNYFADYADYLMVALLEEDAQALDDDYHWITDI